MAPQLTSKQWVLSHLLLTGLLCLALFQAADLSRPLAFKMLDIGQGDALLIQTPEHKNILIDAGPGSQILEQLGKEFGFFERTIDLFISTHPDRDHYVGILDVLDRYKVGAVMLTGVANPDVYYQTFLDKIKRQKIPVLIARADQDIRISKNIYLDILFPLPKMNLIGQKVKNKNDTSIVARIIRNKDGIWEPLIMLTGDAERKEEEALIYSGQHLQSEILKLGHHGAKTSTSAAFLKAVSPKVALISAGADNKYGHPSPETIEKIKNLIIRSTQKEGTVTIEF